MPRTLVKAVVSNVRLHLIDTTTIGDRYRTLTPASTELSGKGWLDDGTEVDLGTIRISHEREKQLRAVLDAITLDLIGGEDA